MQAGALRWTGVVILIAAAVFEVGGDAIIRRGLRGSSLLLTAVGCLALASYGVTVNLLQQDFSRSLGTYVGVFALASFLAGKLLFGDQIAGAAWLGLAVILVGCAIIQYGST